MEKENDPVFVDPCVVTPRRLSKGEMEMYAGGASAFGAYGVTVSVVIATATALIY